MYKIHYTYIHSSVAILLCEPATLDWTVIEARAKYEEQVQKGEDKARKTGENS